MTNDRGLGAGDAAGSVPTARPILRERNVVVIPAAGGTERELGTLHGISMGSNMRVPNRGLGWMADSRALIDLPLGADGSPVPYLSSTRQDAAPVISPDGGQVALTSGRSGWPEVWVCRSDQSGCHQVSHMNGSMTGFTSWSPDGRGIAFSSNGPSKGGIYIVRPDGSGLREVAAHPAENIAPCWSADGASIYFSSNRSGRYQIWRVAATGGEAEAITDHGHRPLASRDGRWLFLRARVCGTKQAPSARSSHSSGIRRPGLFSSAAGQKGIYYLGPDRRIIRYWEPGVTLPREKFKLPLSVGLGFAVAPDESYFIYSGGKPIDRDLVLIEGVR